MKRLIFLGSIAGTLAAFLMACLVTLATLVWILRVWYPAPWVIGLTGTAMLVTTVVVIWRWWRLPAARRFRFSLRGMLISLGLFALWLGSVGVNVLRLGQEVSAIADMASRGALIGQIDISTDVDWAVTWRLRRLLGGYNPCLKVSWIEIHSDQGLPALVEHAHLFPDLEAVSFETSCVTDAGLERIAELRHFPKLYSVLLRCNITDSALERLASLKQFEELDLCNCDRITDAGMAHIARLRQLDRLVISQIPITDAGLAHLCDMPNLRHVYVRKTAVTSPGILGLCQRLPDCLVTSEEVYFPAVCQTRQIEVWKTEPEARLLATITDVERIAAIKAWLDQDGERRYKNGGRKAWGIGGACLSVRFEGQRRRLTEVGLGNGVYTTDWNNYYPILPADEQQIRNLLGVDPSDWNTR